MLYQRFASILLAGLIGFCSVHVSADAGAENAEREVSQQIQAIDINTATAEQLMQLDNIGPSKAQAIIEYRKANGPFKTLTELQKVKGIGATTIHQNRQRMLAGQ